MKIIILLTFLGIVCADLSREEVNEHFQALKLKFGRNYDSRVEEDLRRIIFEQNLNIVFSHNLEADNGHKSFRLGVNNFTDMTNSEFRAFYNGLRLDRRVDRKSVEIFNAEGIELPAEVDWRTKGVVTPIKNQQQCGSCWAFSAVASIEGQHALKNKKLVSLSEQNLVDCSSAEGNDGCEGGLMDQAFQYVIQNKGIDTEASYPYKAIDENCVFNKKTVGATIVSYTDIPTGDEKALAAAVASIGPIASAMDASQISFQLYASGIYDEPKCSSQQLDHGVTPVGYGTQGGKDYWLVKNMWGTDWGEKGYVLMSRNKGNQCGIATMSSFPKV